MIFILLLGKFETHLLIIQTLPKAVAESMFRLTDFAVRTLTCFKKPLVYCEPGSKSRFVSVWAGCSYLDMTVKILSASSAAYKMGFRIYNWLFGKGFRIHNWLNETR